MPSDRRKRDDEYVTHSAGRISPGAYFGASALFPDAGPEPQLVTLSNVDTVLTIGATIQLASVTRDQFNAIMTGRTPTWVTSDALVATVDSNGLVTATGVGTAQIRAVDGGVASSVFTVVVANSTQVLAVQSGDGQSATVDATFGSPLVARLTAGGSPVANATIRWTTDSDNIVVPASSTTNASGDASITVVAGTRADIASITATGPTGVSVTFNLTVTAGATASVEAMSVTSFSGTPSTAVTTKPSVRVLDAHGNPKSGVTVTFAVTAGGGSGTTLTPSTGADGVATVGSWTTGAGAGENTMTATVGGATGSPVTFTCTTAANAPSSLGTFSGTGQTGIVAGQAAAAFAWKVYDSGASPVPGVLVTFEVTAGGGSLSVASAVTDGTGKAEVTLTTGTTVGVNTVTASIVDVDGNTLSLGMSTTTVAGTATKLVVAVQPASNTNSGQVLPGQPVVHVTDANGNVNTSATNTVTVSVHTGSNATLTPPTALSVAAVAGVATFSGLIINDGDGGTSQLDFAAGGLTGATSSTITVTPPVPAKLAFTTQPANVTEDVAALGCAIQVQASDGTLVGNATNQVTVALTTPNGATLSGTLVLTASGGIATFSGMSVNNPGTYTLTASSPSLTSAISQTFTVALATPGSWPNLPAGLTQTFALQTCDAVPFSGWTFQAGYGTNWTIQGASATPTPPSGAIVSAPSMLRLRIPQGHVGGRGFPDLRTPSIASLNHDEIFVGYYLTLGTDMIGGGSGVMKIIHIWGSTTGSGFSNIAIPGVFWNAGQNRWRFRLSVQGGATRTGNPVSPVQQFGELTLGSTYRIENYCKMNSSASAYDGIFRMTATDVATGLVQQAEWTDVKWSTASNRKWHYTTFDPTYMGTGFNAPSAMHMYFDDIQQYSG